MKIATVAAISLCIALAGCSRPHLPEEALLSEGTGVREYYYNNALRDYLPKEEASGDDAPPVYRKPNKYVTRVEMGYSVLTEMPECGGITKDRKTIDRKDGYYNALCLKNDGSFECLRIYEDEPDF